MGHPKATQLNAALELVPPIGSADCVVVPLLNGLDHVDVLREHFGERVLAASIAIESERADVGRFRQKSAFAEVALAPGARAAQICGELTTPVSAAAWEQARPRSCGRSLRYLRRSRSRRPRSRRRSRRSSPILPGELRLEGCVREVAAVAGAEGVAFDADAAMSRYEQIGDLRSSMQKDREAGRPLELDAIGGAVPPSCPATRRRRSRYAGARRSDCTEYLTFDVVEIGYEVVCSRVEGGPDATPAQCTLDRRSGGPRGHRRGRPRLRRQRRRRNRLLSNERGESPWWPSPLPHRTP
jgi:hypothetical protein